jgi:uncharacterized protein YndB with AHSA1/START domain
VKVSAARELLAPVEDVWSFVSEPYHLPDWWPGISGLRPDRRGFAEGARWTVVGENQPTLFRRPNMTGALIVLAIEPLRRFAFHLTGERIDAELTLERRGPNRTLASLTVDGFALIGLRRAFPRRALDRLYDLCQTAAES